MTANITNIQDRLDKTMPAGKKWNRIHINLKTLIAAIILEIAIICCCAVAGWLFAEKYSDGSNVTWLALVNGGVILTIAELARIGLALNAATHRRRSVRFLSIVAVILSCAVTTETLVLVADMRYGPRLAAVNEARMELDRAKSQLAGPTAVDRGTKAQIQALNGEIKNLDETLKMFGKPPAYVPARYDRNGKLLRSGFQPPWSGKDTQDKRNNAIAKRDGLLAKADANEIEIGARSAEVIKATGAYETAVLHSTIHSLTGMALGKSPGEITDGELFSFLRFFVFLVSFFIAAVSSVLSYGSFTRYEAQDEPRVKRQVQTVEIIPALRELGKEMKFGKGATANG